MNETTLLAFGLVSFALGGACAFTISAAINAAARAKDDAKWRALIKKMDQATSERVAA